eukprot:scaffold234_cov406-Prasinococcus_capsulatus_cf.AAC.12
MRIVLKRMGICARSTQLLCVPSLVKLALRLAAVSSFFENILEFPIPPAPSYPVTSTGQIGMMSEITHTFVAARNLRGKPASTLTTPCSDAVYYVIAWDKLLLIVVEEGSFTRDNGYVYPSGACYVLTPLHLSSTVQLHVASQRLFTRCADVRPFPGLANSTYLIGVHWRKAREGRRAPLEPGCRVVEVEAMRVLNVAGRGAQAQRSHFQRPQHLLSMQLPDNA